MHRLPSANPRNRRTPGCLPIAASNRKERDAVFQMTTMLQSCNSSLARAQYIDGMPCLDPRPPAATGPYEQHASFECRPCGDPAAIDGSFCAQFAGAPLLTDYSPLRSTVAVMHCNPRNVTALLPLSTVTARRHPDPACLRFANTLASARSMVTTRANRVIFRQSRPRASSHPHINNSICFRRSL
jgi:hypothetical protein